MGNCPGATSTGHSVAGVDFRLDVTVVGGSRLPSGPSNPMLSGVLPGEGGGGCAGHCCSTAASEARAPAESRSRGGVPLSERGPRCSPSEDEPVSNKCTSSR